MHFQDTMIYWTNGSRDLYHPIRAIYEQPMYESIRAQKRSVEVSMLYYVLFQNQKLKVYSINNGHLKRITAPKGEFGDRFLFYQNVAYGVSEPGWELGSSVYFRLRHCAELKYPKKQCDNISSDILDASICDTILFNEIPLLLDHGDEYPERKLMILCHKYTIYEETDPYHSLGTYCINSTDAHINLNHVTRLYSYNSYIYALGCDTKLHKPNGCYYLQEQSSDQHQLVCYVLMLRMGSSGPRFIIIDSIVSEPGAQELHDPLNQLLFTLVNYEGDQPLKYWERYFIMTPYKPSSEIRDRHHVKLHDVTIQCSV